MKTRIICCLVFLFCAFVFGDTTIDWVDVGDAGNADDALTGYGGVNYNYRISSKEVTNAQFCEFLNAVGMNDGNVNSDYIWDSSMEIDRDGSAPNYSYTVETGRDNYPARYVRWLDTLRYVNWLHNGKPTGDRDPATTEDGAYTIGDNNDWGATRNPNALYWLPSEDEWYKAAFYKAGSLNAGYWLYATSSDDPPSNVPPTSDLNTANYYYAVSAPYTTVVGGYWQSVSPYGTFDQCGNVEEWTEASIKTSSKPLWGGYYWDNPAPDSSSRVTDTYSNRQDRFGFRIATWPLGHQFNTRQWVLIGDSGNIADDFGYGDVSYEFWMAKTEVTNSQFCEFLNAIGKNDGNVNDDYIWDGLMEIDREGSAPNYSYTVETGRDNYPARSIRWLDTLRYVNWLHNGKPTGDRDPATTEDGAYTIGDQYDWGATRNPDALYWLPSENEWYKAAFYDPNEGGVPFYYPYATSSFTGPINDIPPGGTNSANYYYAVSSSDPYSSAVGAYWQSVSPYGTYDQCGNVEEWTEASTNTSSKPLWGGYYWSNPAPDSSSRVTDTYSKRQDRFGFRIAARIDVIEPAPICLGYPIADLNGDCMVNLIDLSIMASEWLMCNWDPPQGNCPGF